MMAWLPAVGIVVGAAWWGAAELVVFCGLHQALAAAVLTLVPFIMAGFIHLDGYMDTSDAVLSRRPLDEKLRILKDPHTGAFAVIMIAMLFVLQFASLCAIVERSGAVILLVIIPVLSRCGSAISILSIKLLSGEGYAFLFRPAKAAPHRIMTVLLALCAFAFAWLMAGLPGVIVSAAVVVSYAAAMLCALISFKFKGVSGDLAGFSLVISEMCGLIALAVV